MSNTTKILSGSPGLRARLPRGGVKKIADKYGVSWVWAYRIIKGTENPRQDILEDAEALAAIEDESRKKIESVL